MATEADVADMIACRDPAESEGVPPVRALVGYMAGTYHPRLALRPRVVLVATIEAEVVGYISGHLTRRYDCDAEVQWLYVAPEHRRHGIASSLLETLAGWFAEQDARRVCVNVAPTNTGGMALSRGRGAHPLKPQWWIWEDMASTVRR
jgi:GNAT superfamily N-acetyltransferase